MAIEVDADGIFNRTDIYEYDDDYEYKEESELRASAAPWMPLLYLAVLVAGLLGNALLLAVLLSRKRRSWSVAEVYVLHLCVADVLLLLTLPLLAAQAFRRCGWCSQFGLIPCKISTALFYVSL